MGNKVSICCDDNISYVGQIKNKKYHGNGTIYYNDTGNLYKGHFKDGLKHGLGEFQFYNGDKYIGNFYQGEIQGIGKYISTNGYIYEGEFTIGSMFGKGHLYDINNELIYDGEFLNSFPHGFGISYIKNQISYVGYWNQNFYNGHGILFENNSYIYGLFKEGILIEKKDNIPQIFVKYIIQNKKNIYDSNINISKYIVTNVKPIIEVTKEQHIYIPNVPSLGSPTTPPSDISSPKNSNNNIKILCNDKPIIKTVFNPLNIR